MQIDLELDELTLLMAILNVRTCQLSMLETPMETNLMVKIINARNNAVKLLNVPKI